MMFTGTKNFTTAEVACKCGCGMLPDKHFMDKVQEVRDYVGFPLRVTSAARCPEYNNEVSHTGLTGPHTTGRAIDFAVLGHQALRVVTEMIRTGFTGIGVQQKGAARFIHGDDLMPPDHSPRPWIWSY